MSKEPKGNRVNIGPESHARALVMLVEGCSVTYVAETLEITRPTVRRWRDSPEGQAELTRARKAREASFADAAENARRTLREHTDRAAQLLADQLDDPDPAVAQRAARTILDRTGVPRVERVEVQSTEGADLSTLTEEEFVALRAIRAKLRKAGVA